MALKIQKLCLGYGRKQVLENLDVIFQKGITCLLGRNGAGKSSLLKAIFGLVNVQGEIFHNGKIIDRAFIRDEISYIPQSAQAVSNISVFDVVLLGDVFSSRPSRTPSQKSSVSGGPSPFHKAKSLETDVQDGGDSPKKVCGVCVWCVWCVCGVPHQVTCACMSPSKQVIFS